MNNEITILYRDEELVVCLKPAGVDSQGSSFENMVDLLRKQLALPDPREIYPVHRLDRGVGGVMVYALSRPFAAELNRQIAEHRWEKTYLCIVSGKPEKQGRMENLLLHRAGENKTYVVSRVRKGVRRAALVYRRIGYLPQQDCSLCVVRLLTGRSHQIRAQFSHRGFPLLGDRRYGSKCRKGKSGRIFRKFYLNIRKNLLKFRIIYSIIPMKAMLTHINLILPIRQGTGE